MEKITDSLRARLKEIETLKGQLAEAGHRLMEIWARQAKAENGACVICRPSLSARQTQQLAALLSGRCDTAVVCGTAEDGGKICIISSVLDTNALGRHIAGALGGKGGGKPGMYQGVISRPADEGEIRALLDSFKG